MGLGPHANHWLETVVKPYRVQWEAKKREVELLAQLEEVRKQLEKSRKNEAKLIKQLEEAKKREDSSKNTVPPVKKKSVIPIILGGFIGLVIGMVIMGIIKSQPAQFVSTPIPQSAPQPTQTYLQLAQPSSEQPLMMQQSIPDGFVRINGGTFTMGSPSSELGRRSDEVQHQVTVSSFYIGKYEVTQKEYQEVMGTNPSKFMGDNLPVENVSWYDAVEYCNQRSKKEGLIPAYTVNGSNVEWNRNTNGYRLPTEAEWEYACRAGTATAYNTGENISDSTGWYKVNSGIKTHPVGQKLANAWGLYDMHGNVWEWCWDWYGSYSSKVQNDPMGAVSGSFRVLRGGSWYNSAENTRSTYRFNLDPYYRYDNFGFRLVRP